MNIGERIHRARRRAQMTLEEVARQVGISRQTMSRYETGIIGNIPSDKIEMMSKVLHVSPAYIMGWEDEEGNNLLKNKPIGSGSDMSLSEKEQALIMAYRARSDMQGAVDTLLGLPQGTIGNDAANVIRSGERAFVKKNITQG